MLLGVAPIFLLAYLSAIVQMSQETQAYDPHGGIVPLMAGTAERPFVFRALLPALAADLSGGVDASDTTWTPRRSSSPETNVLHTVLRVGDRNMPAATTLFWLSAACFGLYGLCVFYAVRTLQGLVFPMALLAATLAMAVPVLWMIGCVEHVYDSSSLAGAAVLTFFGLRRQILPFLLALTVFSVAKETLVVLSLLLIVPLAYERKWAECAVALAASLAIAIGVRLIILRTFSHCPGVNLEVAPPGHPESPHWKANLLLPFVKTGNFFWICVKLGLVLLPLAKVFRELDRPTRTVLVWSAIAMIVPLVFFGVMSELRVFFELLPLWFVLATPGMSRFLGPSQTLEPSVASAPH